MERLPQVVNERVDEHRLEIPEGHLGIRIRDGRGRHGVTAAGQESAGRRERRRVMRPTDAVDRPADSDEVEGTAGVARVQVLDGTVLLGVVGHLHPEPTAEVQQFGERRDQRDGRVVLDAAPVARDDEPLAGREDRLQQHAPCVDARVGVPHEGIVRHDVISLGLADRERAVIEADHAHHAVRDRAERDERGCRDGTRP